ncbi:MAG: deoxyribodipyrimidine photo-lyase [Hydrogenophaga sp.]|uniref:cryptochrome/photolyase family protein n=1 Tax=Hydrogenophaga sp. TaxID=1904254 RepID=UPI0027372155|nr:deoxyribodipyrimidine photo-lyase [Hydrogenophaga sp.]MDP3345923.1 deoxyribodipyrimidine photo-lyase [Hydrogenophaga sp.]MDP3807439.1 deoxyribodipyrimidine photo-lyase [Hydrogenophaga sp.]MDP3927225.1 deoxyribodipyrimidine photo-lyase [Hydrogenophaga sp.]
MNTYSKGLMWFRRDLRAQDNAALYHALKVCRQVWCVFVFDTDILDPLPRADRRVEFIRESLVELDANLRELGLANGTQGVGLIVLHDRAAKAITALAQRLQVQAVFTNHDDEPAALARDAHIFGDLAHAGILLHSHKDHVIFERREVLTQAGHPFGVFTPYKNAWLKQLTPDHLKPYPVTRYTQALAAVPAEWAVPVPTLSNIGFEKTNLSQLPMPTGTSGAHQLFKDFVQRIDRYHEARNFPAVKGPSYLSVHLRFGTLSMRQVASVAHQMHLQGMAGASTWLSELIWRDFYHQVLANFPHVVDKAFKPEYDHIKFEHGKHSKALFAAWCEGRTGYPLVDAAMAQINQTGYMHNRLRMVVASFLVKDLGIDWRWGERYFAEHLIDFDLSANNGGWQWASSSGCDAQPYFRIFNPVTQSEKFDPHGKFIRRYLPQLAGLPDAAIHAPWKANEIEMAEAGVVLGTHYPAPVVDHAEARARTLLRYAVVKKPGATPK